MTVALYQKIAKNSASGRAFALGGMGQMGIAGLQRI
jgi:hypothetical protein